MAKFTSDEQHGMLESSRDAPPTHCTFTIQSFSLLAKSSIEFYETTPFEAGGYKWKLRLYANGNKNRNVTEHISLYLVMADTDSLPRGWDVNVVFRLFLFDQIQDKYLTIEDANVNGKRFHRTKTEWGFDKFIHLKTLNDASNGYLIDDICIFGAEVFICKESCRSKDKSLSMVRGAVLTKHSWKIGSFSKIDKEYVESETFTAGGQTWKIQFYPKGFGAGKGTHLSLALALSDIETLPADREVYAQLNLRLVHQIDGRAIEGKDTHWFTASNYCRSWSKYSQLSYLIQQGFLQRDSCLVEAEVTVLGVAN